MKSGLRALIVSIALFLLWGTILTGPFRLFADAFSRFFAWVLKNSNIPTVMVGFVMALLLIIAVIVLVILSTKQYSQFMAGICALLTMLFYLITCIQNKSFDSLSFPMAAALALALLFLIFQADRAGLWLSDAYVYSIPVLLFFELILSPLFVTTGMPSNKWSPLFTVPTESIATGIGNFLQIPMLVWSTFLFALMLIPVLYLSKGRKTI